MREEHSANLIEPCQISANIHSTDEQARCHTAIAAKNRFLSRSRSFRPSPNLCCRKSSREPRSCWFRNSSGSRVPNRSMGGVMSSNALRKTSVSLAPRYENVLNEHKSAPSLDRTSATHVTVGCFFLDSASIRKNPLQ